MSKSPRVLVVFTACAALLIELLILVMVVLPTSGPEADAAVWKSAFIAQASVLAAVISLASAIIAIARRTALGRRVFLLGLTPAVVLLLAVATSVVVDLRDPRLGAFRHDLDVELRRSAVQPEPVQVLSIRVVDDIGYNGSGFTDDDGLLEDGIINESFSIQGAGERTLEIELEGMICEFAVPVVDHAGPQEWTDWLSPRSVWRTLPSGRKVPSETEDSPVEVRLRFTSRAGANARP